MGTSNFARPENASKYFVVLENYEEKIVRCNDCDEKYFEYEEQYEFSEEHNKCNSCNSEDIIFDTETVCPNEWEADDLISNLKYEFKNKFTNFGDSNYKDYDRNYPSSAIGDLTVYDSLKDVNISIEFTIIITSAYYEGATLDYLITRYIDGYEVGEEIDFSDLYQSEMSDNWKLKNVSTIQKKIDDIIEETSQQIEEIFEEWSNQYNRIGGFSDGTSLYAPVNNRTQIQQALN